MSSPDTGSFGSQRFDVTVLIVTKNRREELCRAVTSAVAQTGCAIEVLVIDDGSTDGTSQMIRSTFPAVRLERSEQSRGYIVQRNHGAARAKKTQPEPEENDDD